ncbi:hypothetical protein QYF36_024583 [Acer negundo]|nr:hypothetical protein QYF36_024583 [Acer negundo]
MLDEGKLTEEVEEILELLKSTWRVLRITETMHYTCYAWVLFRQYAITTDQGMLRHAIEQLKKIPLKEQRGPQERLHLKSLHCKVEGEEGSRDLSFLQSHDGGCLPGGFCPRNLKWYIYHYLLWTHYILQAVDKTRTTYEHPLALLAEETKKLLRKDSTVFMPVLSKRHPQATIVSASLLHKLYGNKLKLFIDGAEHLTEDVASVFPAADSLEEYIISLITSACEEETAAVYCRKLIPYQVRYF